MKCLENLLTTLFEYQRFARNPDLQRVIDDVEARYGQPQPLSLDELCRVSAAGDPYSQALDTKEKDLGGS